MPVTLFNEQEGKACGFKKSYATYVSRINGEKTKQPQQTKVKLANGY